HHPGGQRRHPARQKMDAAQACGADAAAVRHAKRHPLRAARRVPDRLAVDYPFNLTFGPLVSALAAGNTAILKPSEMTPHCAALMQEMIADLFPEDEVAVIQGAAETTQQLLGQPFDHIFFTGSPT